MLAGLTGMHLLVIVLVVLVLFGASKLPVFAKGLGQSIKVLRSELSTDSARPAAAPVAAEVPPAGSTR
jgi:sec-independent protein translocase protein TatA